MVSSTQAPGATETGLWQIAQATPERCALVTADGQSLSYRELTERINRISNAMLAAGLQRGDAITVIAHNAAEVIELFFAALQCGLYYVPVNYHGTAGDIAYICENSESRYVFFDPDNAVVCTRGLDSIDFAQQGRICTGHWEGVATLSEWSAGHSAARPPSTPSGSLMQYTSGTTGRPKGVRRPLKDLSADQTASYSALQLGWYGMEPYQGPHLVTSPLYHNAVLSHALSALNLGQGVVLMKTFDAQQLLELVERHGVASTHVVATHFHRLLALPETVRNRYRLSSLTHVIHGAVPTPVETKQAMFDWLGPVIYEYYGSSEVGATLVFPQDWLRKPGTVGKPLSITRLKILDDDGRELPAGERGWIYMKQGEERFDYYKDEQKTRKATRGDFICVGDIGYVDDEGFLFLSGRDAEIIISGGVNIYPAATEARLLTHPCVYDVGVIGVPDKEYGEQVKGVVVLNTGYQAGPELERELIEHCRADLSSINCPKSIDFTAALPRDPNGKLLKHKLRAPYWPQDRAL